MLRFHSAWAFAMGMALTATAATPSATSSEFTEAAAWFGRFAPLTSAAPIGQQLPFSFTYGGRSSESFLASWKEAQSDRVLDAHRRQRTLVFTDPATGLEMRCVAVAYDDYPTVEWTLYFRNTGAADTPLLSDIHAIDAQWHSGGAGGFVLHHELGTFFPFSRRDFTPLTTTLGPGATQHLIPLLGRPTGGNMPYFDLERGGGSGAIVVVGWPGAWVADFARDQKDGIRVTAGQELFHARLHPGEEVRSPLMLVQFWSGDWIGAQNTWRRWMIAHEMPKLFGQPVHPFFPANSSLEFGEMIEANEANQIHFIDRYIEERIPIDAWWMDAGWYENHGRWQEPIAWKVDRARFPHGLRAITDHAHSLGLKTIVWFEPERVMSTNSLFKEHPEWLLRAWHSKLASRLLYLGNPDALKWITDVISRDITEQGIDVYRQDFNFVEPVDLWRSNDTEDRQGITENHHITGYLAFWDELLRRHPGLVIDSCAGGGSRNDLETLRRALPFYRSDYRFDVVSNQSQSYGIALWLPFIGTGSERDQLSLYQLRSNMDSAIFMPSWDMRDPRLPYGRLRSEMNAWKQYAKNYLGDYYPLTPDSLAEDVWIAWQFNRPEAGRGMVQAFRHSESPYDRARFVLRGLDPAARYRFSDLDRPDFHPIFSGRELMAEGLDVSVPEKPGAVVLPYEKLP